MNIEAQQPLVSVIVPCYNYADFIAGCMESVLNQTYRNLELIVVDDGSSDDSLERIARVADLDSRVRVISQDNRGVAHARNRGLSESGGELVLYVDADDQLLPAFLEKTVERLLASEPNTFVYTQYRMHGAVDRVSNCGEFSVDRLKVRNFVGICALHWKHHLKGIRFDPGLEMDEDYDFILSVAKRGIVGSLVDEILVSKRQHRDSRNSTGQIDLKCYRTRRRIVHNHRDFFSKAEAGATLYNAKVAALRAIGHRRERMKSRRARLEELLYVMRYIASPKEWCIALRYWIRG